jgi:predicted porin
MRKSSALAVAFFWGPSLALAAGPSLYGKINVSLEQVDFEGAGLAGPTTAEQWELNSNASRLGVKGDFDLQVGGLKALYLLEYGIDVDGDEDETFTKRNLYAGLEGGFGTLIAGNIDSPLKSAEGKVDQFNDLYADIDHFLGGQTRNSNSVQYISPKWFGGLTVHGAFSPGEQDDVDDDGEPDDGLADIVSAALIWERDGLYAALAYEKDQAARRSVDGIVRGDLLRAVTTYRWHALELGALYQQARDAAPGSDLEDRGYLLSAAWHLDERITVKAQAGENRGKESDEKLSLWAVGADYQLAKNATAFVYLSRLERDQAGSRDHAAGTGLIFKF